MGEQGQDKMQWNANYSVFLLLLNMQPKRKASKSHPKKQTQSPAKLQLTLADQLYASIAKPAPALDPSLINAAILESLLTKDQQQLSHILATNSDSQLVNSAVRNLVGSKADLLGAEIINLLQTSSSQHLYVWLLAIYTHHASRLTADRVAQLEKAVSLQTTKLPQLLALEGKLQLINF